MAITLAEINRVTLRQVFLPWIRSQGLPLPPGWNPTDDELAVLARRFVEAADREEPPTAWP